MSARRPDSLERGAHVHAIHRRAPAPPRRRPWLPPQATNRRLAMAAGRAAELVEDPPLLGLARAGISLPHCLDVLRLRSSGHRCLLPFGNPVYEASTSPSVTFF